MKNYILLTLLCAINTVSVASERTPVPGIGAFGAGVMPTGTEESPNLFPQLEKEALVREMALDVFWGKLSIQKTCKARCLRGYTRENIDAAEKSPIASCLDSCKADFESFEKAVRKNKNASVPKKFLPKDHALVRIDGILCYNNTTLDNYDNAIEAVVKGRIPSIKEWDAYWKRGQRFVSGPEHIRFN